jgi:RNA polymerase sigma factor (sigma-70 family)
VLEQDSADRLTDLFSRYADTVHAYAVTRAGLDAAPDVVADTFLVAWRRLNVLPEPPLPWLLATARRVAATHRRSRARQVSLAQRMAQLARSAPELMPEGPVDYELWQALDRLPPREREALILVAWFDLTNSDAATVQGGSVGAFAVRLHRARRKLQRELGIGTAGQSAGAARKKDINDGHTASGPAA